MKGAPMSEEATKEIIYIGDPMCSWCYGFSPTIQHLYQKHKNTVKMRLVVGGLHAGDNCIQTPERIQFLRDHWKEIGDRSGQAFKFDILENEGWHYETERCCRAVVTVRKLKPGSEYPYFANIQAGFYAENKDTNSDDMFADAATEYGIDRDEFLNVMNAEDTRQETAADFQWSRSTGVNGFPTVLVKDEKGLAALTMGYQPLEALEAPLQGWIDS